MRPHYPRPKRQRRCGGEAPVLVNNLLATLRQQTTMETYDGYTCCPLITGYNYTMMAEFDYDNRPVGSFFDESRQRTLEHVAGEEAHAALPLLGTDAQRQAF